MSEQAAKKVYEVAVMCRNAASEPDIFFCEVECTDQELSEAKHYDMAIWLAKEDDYEGPFIAVDRMDAAADLIKWPSDELAAQEAPEPRKDQLGAWLKDILAETKALNGE